MGNNYSELIRILEKSKPSKILLITFEDSEILKLLKENYKGELTVFSKVDFVGAGLKEISLKIRNQNYDLSIISNVNAQVNRNKTSLKILALISKSFRHLIFFDDHNFVVTNKLKLLIELIPVIFAGSINAVYVILKTILFFNLIYPFFLRKKKVTSGENKLILFLRTDLAGKIKAGGSLTHIKGFIDGSKELGFDTIYAGDFPLINHPISIVIKPNPLLDFFDEIQMMDYHFKVVKRFRKCLRNIRVGLIYQRHSIFNASGVVLSHIFNVPLILEVNNSEVWAKKNWSRLIFEKLATKIEKFAFENSDLISVVSEVTKEQIVSLGADENKIVVNPNGVNPEKFSPEISGKSIREQLKLDDFYVVGFIGTFTRWHGVETLFDAAIEVLSNSDKIKFLLIGDGNLKSHLELKTEQLGLKDKIIFTGIIPHEKAPEYLAACDVLISPHLGFESGERFFGSPTKLFEYMAMGKPIIASELEQIGQIIRNEINGLLFKPGDVKELSNLILRLFNDSELSSRLGKKAREDVIKNYTWTKNAMRVLEKFYDIRIN